MKAFLFASNNEFKGKFNVSNELSLASDFREYKKHIQTVAYDYVEYDGKTWTVVDGESGLELAVGRIDPVPSIPKKPAPKVTLPISTTDILPGHEITGNVGVVFGEAVMGANVLRDIVGSFTDFFGGRSGVYQSKLQDGRTIAIQEMMDEACRKGGNAVIGVKVDYETVGSSSSMFMICASGTAVVIDSESTENGSSIGGRVPTEEELNQLP